MKRLPFLLKRYYYPLIIILAIIIKCIITVNLPIIARDPIGTADESLMLQQAEYLARWQYLGPYNYLTLVKGIAFPLFLAFSYKIGIPLLLLYACYYAFACLISLVPVRRFIKTRPLQLIFFLVLLFCPASMDNNVQLIYRNMLIIPQSVLLVSSLIMMFVSTQTPEKKYPKLLFWSILASLTWVFMWHTREDTIWSLPLVLVACLACIIATCLHKQPKIRPILIISLPLCALFLSIHLISLLNYHYYGVYTANQLNDSNYTKAVTLIMKIRPKQEIERVEITRETLQRLYNFSPSLATLKDKIESDYEAKNGLVMAAEDNGEINEDLITWELTGAAAAQGYYQTAQTAEAFWGDVYQEINLAVNSGQLETRATLPSRSLIPFPSQPGSLAKLLSSIASLHLRAARYEHSLAIIDTVSIDTPTAQRYEAISGGYAVYPDAPSSVNALKTKASRWTTYANRIRKIYRFFSPPLLVVSFVFYLVLTIRVLVDAVRKRTQNHFSLWLFLSAIFCSFTVILVGLGYVNAFMVDVNGYLASVNGLLNLFIALATTSLIQDALNKFYYSPQAFATAEASFMMLNGIYCTPSRLSGKKRQSQ